MRQIPLRFLTIPAILALLAGGPACSAEMPRILVMSIPTPEGSHYHAAALAFRDALGKYSSGKLQVRLHWLGNPDAPAMGGEEDNVRAISAGSGLPDLTLAASTNLASRSAVLGILSVPYLFRDVAGFRRLLDSSLWAGQILPQVIHQAGFRPLAWIQAGFRMPTNSWKPIRTLADLKGLRIRTPLNPEMIATYRALGAEPVPLRYDDLPEALRSGKVQGQENPWATVDQLRLWELGQRYICEVHPVLWTGALIINEHTWKSLDADSRTALAMASEVLQQEGDRWIAAREDAIRTEAREHGMIITQASDEDAWAARARTTWDLFHARVGSGDAAAGKALLEQARLVTETYP